MITIRKMPLRPPHSIPPPVTPQYPNGAVDPNAGHNSMQLVLSKGLLALNHVNVFSFASLSSRLPAERTFPLFLTPISSDFPQSFSI